MSTNYRSPAEVFELAAKVVVAAVPYGRPARGGALDRRRTAARDRRLRGTVRRHDRGSWPDLLADVEGTVGVIGPPVLKDELSARLGDGAARGRRPAGVVTPLEAKGLEYDGVLVVDAGRDRRPSSPGGVRSLYVALTRPTQRLVTLDAADLVQVGVDLSGRAGTVLGVEVQAGRAAVQQLPRDISVAIGDAHPPDLIVVVGHRVAPARRPRRAARHRRARRTAPPGGRW